MRKTILNFLFAGVFSLFLNTTSKGISENFPEKDETKISVVVIDPGHGGKDWGASMGNAKEKDIVLDISLKLGNYIKTNYPHIKIIYTRSKDVFIPLYQRANIANSSNADLFISIHVNAVEQKSAQGTETFVLGQHRSKDNLEVAKKENSVILLEEDYSKTYEGFDPNSSESYIMFELVQNEYLSQSVMLASTIQDEFREGSKRIDRSVKQAGFLVLRRTTMPSVLVETGFLSHTDERKYLLSESGKTNLASAIFSAFKAYKRKIEAQSSFNLIVKNHAEPTKEASIKLVQNNETELSENIHKYNTGNLYFSVQIAAAKKRMDPTSTNFNGETNIFRIDSKDINRYYSGKFNSYNEALTEKNRLQKNYPTAFVVAFKNNKLISVKKALGKM